MDDLVAPGLDSILRRVSFEDTRRVVHWDSIGYISVVAFSALASDKFGDSVVMQGERDLESRLNNVN